MIQLRSSVIRGTAAGNWRTDPMPFTRYPDAPRYCTTCGCRLRTTNRLPQCDPCDDQARSVRERWYEEHGV